MRRYAILLGFLFPCALLANTIILRNGQILYGSVVRQDRSYVLVSTEKGTKKIQKRDIARILYQDERDPARLKKILKKIVVDTPPPSEDLSDIEIVDVTALMDEIQEEERRNSLLARRNTAVTRSLAFPGWGHYKEKQNEKAILYGGLFLGSALYAGTRYTEYSRARKDAADGSVYALNYASVGPDAALPVSFYISQKRKQTLQTATADANTALAILLLTYLWPATDAYLFLPVAAGSGEQSYLTRERRHFQTAPVSFQLTFRYDFSTLTEE
jgi:hypothetical protein